MKYNIEKLIELDLLKKIPRSKIKAKKSIKNAEFWIKESKNNFKSKSFRSCILTSYLAIFHAARSILFVNGFREKSHFAIARFLEDKYVNKNLLEEKWIKMLDYYRETRHKDQYSIYFITTKDEAKEILDFSKEFLEEMKKLLNKINKNLKTKR